MAQPANRHPLAIQAERIAGEKLFNDCFLAAPPAPDNFAHVVSVKEMTMEEYEELPHGGRVIARRLDANRPPLTVEIYQAPEEREVSWRIRFATKASEYLKRRAMRTE